MPHGPANELAEDVAATLVARQDAVRDEERHRPRVVSDDLVAEAFRLERARIVAQELSQGGMDRREEIRVVVAQDLLADAGHPFEAHAGVDAREREG